MSMKRVFVVSSGVQRQVKKNTRISFKLLTFFEGTCETLGPSPFPTALLLRVESIRHCAALDAPLNPDAAASKYFEFESFACNTDD